MEAWLASKPPGWLDRWIAYHALENEGQDAGPEGDPKPKMLTPEQALMQMRMGFGVG